MIHLFKPVVVLIIIALIIGVVGYKTYQKNYFKTTSDINQTEIKPPDGAKPDSIIRGKIVKISSDSATLEDAQGDPYVLPFTSDLYFEPTTPEELDKPTKSIKDLKRGMSLELVYNQDGKVVGVSILDNISK